MGRGQCADGLRRKRGSVIGNIGGRLVGKHECRGNGACKRRRYSARSWWDVRDYSHGWLFINGRFEHYAERTVNGWGKRRRVFHHGYRGIIGTHCKWWRNGAVGKRWDVSNHCHGWLGYDRRFEYQSKLIVNGRGWRWGACRNRR